MGGPVSAHHRHGDGNQSFPGNRTHEGIADSRLAGDNRGRSCGMPTGARQQRQSGAEGNARIEQHAHRFAGIGENDVAAEAGPETLRFPVKLRPAFFIVHHRGERQHVQGTDACIKVMIDRGSNVAGQVGRLPDPFFLDRADAVVGHP